MPGQLRRLTTERTAIVIVFLLLFAMASRVSVDPDMWWQIRLGEQSIETGKIVYADSFSHTHSGLVHKNHSWLAQVVMAFMWRLGGHLGLTLFVASTAVGGMIFLHRAGRGSIYMQGFVLVLGGACAAAFWSPRPQMLTFLFAATILFLLRRLKRNGRMPLWSLPIVMWLWGNLHGGYIIGYLFIGAFVLGEGLNRLLGTGESAVSSSDLRRLCGLTLFSLALLPINPLGLHVFTVPFETLGISGLRQFIQEWKSPDFAQPATWSFAALIVVVLAVTWASRRKLDLSEWLLMGGTLFMALYSARHISLFAITAVPVVTTHLDTVLARKGWVLARRSEETPIRVALNLALICLVMLGTIARVGFVSSPETVNQSLALNYPVAAVEFLIREPLEGKLFNSYNWGGYLIFNAAKFPVFIDGRTDLYRDFLDEYIAAAFGRPDWPEVFARHEIDIVLIESAGPLAGRLDADRNWQQIYRDEVASIYILLQPSSEVESR